MDDLLKIKIDANIDIPSTPNFIRIKTRKDPKAGFDSTISIADFTDNELREIGEKWTQKLIENAKAFRSLR